MQEMVTGFHYNIKKFTFQYMLEHVFEDVIANFHSLLLLFLAEKFWHHFSAILLSSACRNSMSSSSTLFFLLAKPFFLNFKLP